MRRLTSCVLTSLLLISGGAQAASTRFFCSSQEAAEIVADIASKGEEAVNEVTKPMIASGTCVFIAEPRRPITFSINTVGKTFGANRKLTVVEFLLNVHDGLSYSFFQSARYLLKALSVRSSQ